MTHSRTNKLALVLLAVIVILTTIAYGAVHQPILALFYLLVGVLVLLWAVDALATGQVRFSRNMLQLPLIAAAVYGFIQSVPFGAVADFAGVSGIPYTISLNPFATKLSAIHFLALFLLFAVMLVLLDSASRIRRMTIVIVMFGFAYAFFAILQSVLSPLKIYGIFEAGSSFGSFVNRHNFAAYMEMTMALPLGLLFAGAVSRDKRLLYLTGIGLMGVALLLSGSRGGLIAFLAEVIFLTILVTGTRHRSRLVLKLGLAAALVLAIVGGAIFVGGDTSLTRVANLSSDENLSTGRSRIWGVTLSVIKENLPLGAGLGAFGVAYTPHDEMSGLERVEQAHNDYLQVIADAGLVGLLIGAFFLYQIFMQGRRATRIDNIYRRGIAFGALAGIFAVLVHSVFDFVLHTTAVSVLFLLLLALLSASQHAYADDVENDPRERVDRRRSGSVSSIASKRRSYR